MRIRPQSKPDGEQKVREGGKKKDRLLDYNLPSFAL
jgi:hypothetical protein